ncbi:hypothetical protein BD410DRAFT_892850, partial [Rickenella mellea]
MIITSTIISTALSSLSLVYQAYVRVKTNKSRCKKLAERCHTVVERLQATIADIHDEVLEDRISYLELVFQHAAKTIREVGQQGIIASILKTEENALKIDDCQHELSELVSLLNLQQVIDISKWQSEHEEARVRDHKAALDASRRLEAGNTAILEELSLQGATLADVTRMVRHLSLNLGPNGNSANTGRPPSDAGDVLLPSAPHLRVYSTRRSKVLLKDWLSLEASFLEHSLYTSVYHSDRCSSQRKNLPGTIGSVIPRKEPFQVHENDMEIPPPAYEQLAEGFSHCQIGEDRHDRQVTVQLWTLPTRVKSCKLISLDDFVLLDRRHLHLLKSRIKLIIDTIRPLLRVADVTSDPRKVLLLCPDDSKPHIVHVKTDHSRKSNYIQGFFLSSSAPQTLVAIQCRTKTHWMLTPYSGDLRIVEAKDQIAKHFSPAIVVSCRSA